MFNQKLTFIKFQAGTLERSRWLLFRRVHIRYIPQALSFVIDET